MNWTELVDKALLEMKPVEKHSQEDVLALLMAEKERREGLSEEEEAIEERARQERRVQ